MQNERITTYREFWPFYLSQHAKPKTRAFHAVGTTSGILVALLCIITGQFWFIPLSLVAVYGVAWYSHFYIEHNRPATFTYPFWSFISDFRMLWWMVTGRL